MIHVTVKGYTGEWKLDTPDPTLIGTWLKAIFDEVQVNSGARLVPLTFTVEIS